MNHFALLKKEKQRAKKKKNTVEMCEEFVRRGNDFQLKANTEENT